MLVKSDENKQLGYVKPVSLVNINRQDLTPISNKILNYFIYKATMNKSIGSEIVFENDIQYTTLSEIAIGIGDMSRKPVRLKENILKLSSASAGYGVYNIEGDDNHLVKKNSQGTMTYIDYVEIFDDGSVEYKLGTKFYSFILNMLQGNERYFRPSLSTKNKLTSISSTVIYEIASCYTNNASIPLLRIDESLMDLLGMSRSYVKNIYDFKKRVISPALQQLRNKNVINLDYEILDKNDGKYIKIFKDEKTIEVKPDSIYVFIAKRKNADSIKGYAKQLEKAHKADPVNGISNMYEWEKQYEDYINIHNEINRTVNKTDVLKKRLKELKGTADMKKLFYYKDSIVFYELDSYLKSLKHGQDDFIITLLLLDQDDFTMQICSQSDKEFFNNIAYENYMNMIEKSLEISAYKDSTSIVVNSETYQLYPNGNLNIDALRYLEHECSLNIKGSKLGFKNIRFYKIMVINMNQTLLILDKEGSEK